MTYIRKHFSPALVLSVVAVFIALGGGAYAALGKNSVGSKQIKKNAVTTKKIKKNAVVTSKIKKSAVTAAKIKDETITGDKIDEGSLGIVPTAANAKKTDGYSTLPQTSLVASAGADYDTARDAAEKHTLYTDGPITIYAKCFTDSSGPYTNIVIYAETTENGVIFDSDNEDASGDPDFLDMTTLEDDRDLLSEAAGANAADVSMDDHYGATFMTPSGTSFAASLGIAVKNGTLVGGNGIYGAGNVCLVDGSFIQYTG